MSESARPQPPRAHLAGLPSVDRVLRELADSGASARPGLAELVRAELAAVRAAGASGAALPAAAQIARRVLEKAAALPVPEAAYPRVVNATGVLLHTGLGRAPLAESAAAALASSAGAFLQLEVDRLSGERRHREAPLLPDLLALTGGESATVVNNNAAALLLALAALAGGRQVLVSRGELIEIGGGFRLPELMAQSGCQLVEVGTTNRTYIEDYERACNEHTALLLLVHTSNYRVEGFAHSPAREELVALARRRGLPLLEDLGSGLLAEAPGSALAEEPAVRASLSAGVDLVCFSGDKLLGGPQAGLLVGRQDLVAACRRHPLFRALRPDRLQLVALAATLAAARRDPGLLPVHAALTASPGSRQERARQLADRLAAAFPQARFVAQAEAAQAGSGSLPTRELPSAAVAVQWPGLLPEALAQALRRGQPPVFARLRHERVQLDVLGLLPGDEDRLVAAFAALAAAPA
ncbi:MAG: L-seryl-tRNA(Sec) selenium transferase [Planctomycetota bacterium]